jgi:hypothetical protein
VAVLGQSRAQCAGLWGCGLCLQDLSALQLFRVHLRLKLVELSDELLLA